MKTNPAPLSQSTPLENTSVLRAVYTIEEVMAKIGGSKTFVYDLIKKGELPSIRLGRRVYCPRAALDRLLAGEK